MHMTLIFDLLPCSLHVETLLAMRQIRSTGKFTKSVERTLGILGTEMYAGRVACCPLVSHVEYAPRVL